MCKELPIVSSYTETDTPLPLYPLMMGKSLKFCALEILKKNAVFAVFFKGGGGGPFQIINAYVIKTWSLTRIAFCTDILDSCHKVERVTHTGGRFCGPLSEKVEVRDHANAHHDDFSPVRCRKLEIYVVSFVGGNVVPRFCTPCKIMPLLVI